MKYAQDYIKGSVNCMAGFNCRIMGETYTDTFRYPHNYSMYGGWDKAGRMIEEGIIYFRHNFHHSHSDCGGHAFLYGGSWVCNDCGRSGVDEKWWIIRVYKGCDVWCCVGEGFVDLQTSCNYALGNTREEAIKNYGDLWRQNED